jgi:hypothetical protein
VAENSVEIDADWITTIVFGVLLLGCSLLLALAVRRFVSGIAPRRTTVDFSTYLTSGLGLYGAFVFKDKALKIVFALLFVMNAAYLVLHWLSVGAETLRLATGGTSIANIFVLGFLWFFLARWFKEKIRLKRSLGVTSSNE